MANGDKARTIEPLAWKKQDVGPLARCVFVATSRGWQVSVHQCETGYDWFVTAKDGTVRDSGIELRPYRAALAAESAYRALVAEHLEVVQ